jgi:Lon protease-like protein
MDEKLPLFPLNTVLFPGMLLPLHIFEERYREMLRDCMAGEKAFGVALIRSGSEVGAPALPHAVGTLARIVRHQPLDDGRSHLVAQGERRFRVREVHSDRPYLRASVEWLDDADLTDPDLPAFAREVGREFKQYLSLLLSFTDQWIGDLEIPAEPQALSFAIAIRLHLHPPLKQGLLEMDTVRGRLAEERKHLRQEKAHLEKLVTDRLTSEGSGPVS